MTDKRARILQFILERKKPITAKVVAQQFLIAQSTAATHLRELHNAGYISRNAVKTEIVWGPKDSTKDAAPPMPVAVPDEVIVVQPRRPTPVDWEPPKPIWPDNPFKTSYPHVRGYDD